MYSALYCLSGFKGDVHTTPGLYPTFMFFSFFNPNPFFVFVQLPTILFKRGFGTERKHRKKKEQKNPRSVPSFTYLLFVFVFVGLPTMDSKRGFGTE